MPSVTISRQILLYPQDNLSPVLCHGPTQEMEFVGPGGEGPSRSTPVSTAMC